MSARPGITVPTMIFVRVSELISPELGGDVGLEAAVAIVEAMVLEVDCEIVEVGLEETMLEPKLLGFVSGEIDEGAIQARQLEFI
jgi:hypothetical protein